MAVEVWNIYFCPQCQNANPPKDKYVIVACFDEQPMGFFINSNINQWLQNRPYMLVCEAPILHIEHAVLRYDSWVDCQGIYRFEESELTNHLGTVSMNARK
jgi:hypothetical protein